MSATYQGSILPESGKDESQDFVRGRLKQNRPPQSHHSTDSSETSKKTPIKCRLHARSHLHTKLGSTSSSTALAQNTARPNLKRSKSSELHVKSRSGGALNRNRTLTKVNGLLPLTKSSSNQSIRSIKSTASLRGLSHNIAPGYGGSGIGPLSGLKTSLKKERAILRMNDEDNDDLYEDIQDSMPENPVPQRFEFDQETSSHKVEDILPDPTLGHRSSLEKNVKHGGDEQGQNLTISHKNYRPTNTFDVDSAASSIGDFSNMYGGSLLLSQSTGVVRNVGQKLAPQATKSAASNSVLPFHATPIASISMKQSAMTVKKTNDHYSSENLNINSILLHNYQNEPPANSAAMPRYAGQMRGPNDPMAINSSETMTEEESKGDHHHDTRTQQRLWLQRENSMMDVLNLGSRNLDLSNLSLNQLMFSHTFSSNNSGSLKNGMSLLSSDNDALISNSRVEGNTAALNSIRLPLVQTDSSAQDKNSEADNWLQHQLESAHVGLHTDNAKSAMSLNWMSLVGLSIQLRTEFERIHREYLNVRRYTNPVNESLNRTRIFENGSLGIELDMRSKNGQELQGSADIKSGSTFKDVSELYHENNMNVEVSLRNVWQDAVSDLLPTIPISAKDAPSTLQTNRPRPLPRPGNLRQTTNYMQHGAPSLRCLQTSASRSVKLET